MNKSPNPFDEITSRIEEVKKMIESLPKPEKESQDLLRFIPVKDLYERKICSKKTLYAHVRAGNVKLYKFGNKSFVDRKEFEGAFHPVIIMKKVA